MILPTVKSHASQNPPQSVNTNINVIDGAQQIQDLTKPQAKFRVKFNRIMQTRRSAFVCLASFSLDLLSWNDVKMMTKLRHSFTLECEKYQVKT